jgi:hypothetical protein
MTPYDGDERVLVTGAQPVDEVDLVGHRHGDSLGKLARSV